MSPSRRRAIGAVHGLASRKIRTRIYAPPHHRRGARLDIPHTLRVLHAADCQRGHPARSTMRGRAAHPARCHDRAAIYPRALRTATGRCGAMRTSRPTAITHTIFARDGSPPRCGPDAVGRDARPPPPVGLPTLPARTAAPLPWRLTTAVRGLASRNIRTRAITRAPLVSRGAVPLR